VIRDDATIRIYYAQLVAEQSTRTVKVELREVIERAGLFCTLQRLREPLFHHAQGG